MKRSVVNSKQRERLDTCMCIKKQLEANLHHGCSWLRADFYVVLRVVLVIFSIIDD